jgi:hypothetical protein
MESKEMERVGGYGETLLAQMMANMKIFEFGREGVNLRLYLSVAQKLLAVLESDSTFNGYEVLEVHWALVGSHEQLVLALWARSEGDDEEISKMDVYVRKKLQGFDYINNDQFAKFSGREYLAEISAVVRVIEGFAPWEQSRINTAFRAMYDSALFNTHVICRDLSDPNHVSRRFDGWHDLYFCSVKLADEGLVIQLFGRVCWLHPLIMMQLIVEDLKCLNMLRRGQEYVSGYTTFFKFIEDVYDLLIGSSVDVDVKRFIRMYMGIKFSNMVGFHEVMSHLWTVLRV